MTEKVWPERFETILRQHLTLLDEGRPIVPDMNLVDAGLDSLATVSLLLELESAFSIVVPDEMLTATTLSTPSALWQMVDGLSAEPSSERSAGTGVSA